MTFSNRIDAGERLAARLLPYAGEPGLLVLGLPRGGVVVASEIARALRAPLDILVVRKLGVPRHEELAMGAIASGNIVVVNEEICQSLGISRAAFQQVVAQEQEELARREHLYRDQRPLPEVRDRSVILVDDGLATGSTMQAAVAAIQTQSPRRVIIAVPVAAAATFAKLRTQVDALVCLSIPEPFYGVGQWYDDFGQTTDDEVCRLLDEAWQRTSGNSLARGLHPLH